MKKFFKNFYLLLIFLFLYAPIVVLMIFSFNDSKSRRLWNGFTTRWYVELFRDADILHSLYVTLLVAVAAAEHLRNNEGGDRRHKYHCNAGNHTGNAQREDHTAEH